ncbi:MAG TPA: class I SAM-dependent methyltransferase [Rhizomicrobium sp.]|jgi:predicted O-methyltransferase YrrM|nr:class I SAM-dependent methyltransferase [Rhizomicrobium sp.]
MTFDNGSSLVLPQEETLVTELFALSHDSDAIRRYLLAFQTRTFTDPDGRTERLDVVLPPAEAALLAWLARRSPTRLSIETGFGMGSSTAVIVGARATAGQDFEHLAFDPFRQRGAVVQSYLETNFGERFRRFRERSEVGLGKLLGEHGAQSVGLAFIDGGHHFETVMTDFRLADLLCCNEGFVVFDDATSPAIETVVNYVRCNRPDYAIAHLPVPNTTVLKKCAPDRRDWSDFKPFPVEQRKDWTSTRRSILGFHPSLATGSNSRSSR